MKESSVRAAVSKALPKRQLGVAQLAHSVDLFSHSRETGVSMTLSTLTTLEKVYELVAG